MREEPSTGREHSGGVHYSYFVYYYLPILLLTLSFGFQMNRTVIKNKLK